MYYSKNKYFVREHIKNTLSQMGYFYTATKSNKKKVKDYFHTLPFFFFDNETQDILYKIIYNTDITSNIDKQSSFRVLCYNIYKDFCMKYKTSFVSYSEFYRNIEFRIFSHEYYIRKERQNNIHSFILFLLVITLGTFYYLFSEKNISGII
jgi:hypothetical protein